MNSTLARFVSMLRRRIGRKLSFFGINETNDISKKSDAEYARKIAEEQARYKNVDDINVLPGIFHYWSHTYLKPMVEEFGVSHPDQWFASNLMDSALRAGSDRPSFISIGAGNCDTEIRVAKLLKDSGLADFSIECLDLNQAMLARGMAMAANEGLADCLTFTAGDFNKWHASKQYAGVMANQSLHHVLNLESLFDEIKRALHPDAMFVISDIIGRNGHMRWPEALTQVHRFWREMPETYRYNQQLRRYEPLYENWDCSGEGFEGIRAQDILPLLLQRFEFYKFIGFGNVIDPFIDRAFGHNFDENAEWDKNFIDGIHAFDEASFADGTLKPAHMFAVLTLNEPPDRMYSRGLLPQNSVRIP